jgi:hypothetical protein
LMATGRSWLASSAFRRAACGVWGNSNFYQFYLGNSQAVGSSTLRARAFWFIW